VGVEVVTVGAEDAAEAVGRVGDLDLERGQPAFEEGTEEAWAGGGAVRRGGPLGQPCLEPVLFVAVDEVVVVVAGEEDEALAGQLGLDQVEQAAGSVDGVVDRAEEEVEEVAEEDQLVDVLQRRRQPFEEELLGEQVAPGPGAEVGVGDDQRAASRRIFTDSGAGASSSRG
jgi:hypothetical protein